MTQAKTRFRTLEEYAALDPSELPEGYYELVDGEIVEMGAESDENREIVTLLLIALSQLVSPKLLRVGTEIAVSSKQVTSRFPDLMVLTEATRTAMNRGDRSIVTPDIPAPALVVEVVSPGKPSSDNYKRDYEWKPQEYAKRGIPEFWRIDPDRSLVSVLVLKGGRYVEQVFRGDDRIVSPTFPALNLTAHQILAAGEGV